jgi:hypothetical protein
MACNIGQDRLRRRALPSGAELFDIAFAHDIAMSLSGPAPPHAAATLHRAPTSLPNSSHCHEAAPVLEHTVDAVLSQPLYIEKEGLPAALLNRLKRLAAFSASSLDHPHVMSRGVMAVEAMGRQ